MSNQQVIIGVDFDGTVVRHRYPEVGEPCDGALEVLRECVRKGAKIVLWTMRSGSSLVDACMYLKDAGIDIWGVNKNPHQHTWTQSPKAYCNIYIDDAALGCPLINVPGDRPYVDWEGVRTLLEEKGVL